MKYQIYCMMDFFPRCLEASICLNCWQYWMGEGILDNWGYIILWLQVTWLSSGILLHVVLFFFSVNWRDQEILWKQNQGYVMLDYITTNWFHKFIFISFARSIWIFNKKIHTIGRSHFIYYYIKCFGVLYWILTPPGMLTIIDLTGYCIWFKDSHINIIYNMCIEINTLIPTLWEWQW